MQPALRSCATAGVALVGAGAIALSPIAPSLPEVQVASPPVQLSAAIDPITPWLEVFNTSSANATQLANFYFNAPAPVLQQVTVNQVAFLGQLLNDPASIVDIIEEAGGNLRTLFEIATFLGLEFDINDNDSILPLAQSNDAFHALLVALLPVFLPPDDPTTPIIATLVQFLASPASGVLIGAVGPVISPAVALLNSIQALTDAEDFEAALQTLVSLPADVVGSFFNGATLNLDALVPLIAEALPEDLVVTSLSFAFGGLLTPGVTTVAVGSDMDELIPGIGGSIINSLGLGVNALGLELDIPGQPVGPLGALTNLSQMLAYSIGWDGTGNPLTDLTFPILNTIDPLSGISSPLPAADKGPDQVPAGLLDSKVPVVKTPTEQIFTKNAPVTTDVILKDGAGVDASTLEIDTPNDPASKPARGPLLTKLFQPKGKQAASETRVQRNNERGNRLPDAVKSVRQEVKSAVSNIGKGLKPRAEKADNSAADTQ